MYLYIIPVFSPLCYTIHKSILRLVHRSNTWTHEALPSKKNLQAVSRLTLPQNIRNYLK